MEFDIVGSMDREQQTGLLEAKYEIPVWHRRDHHYFIGYGIGHRCR